MKWHGILSDAKELLQITGEKLIESPKPAIAVYSYSFTMGFLSTAFDVLKTGLPFASMVVGFIGATLMARLTWKKSQREAIATETEKLENRMARERMRLMGIELRDEDEKP
jgi:hypothetical protein